MDDTPAALVGPDVEMRFVEMLELKNTTGAELLLPSNVKAEAVGDGRVEILGALLLTLDPADELSIPAEKDVGNGATVRLTLLFRVV